MELFITCLAVSTDTQGYMGHMKEQGIELNNLTMTFPLSGAEAQRALVLVLLLLVSELGFHWTKFSKFFYGYFLSKVDLGGFTVLLPYCTTTPVWIQWGQKEPRIEDRGGKGNISWVLGVPEGLQCPQESWRQLGHAMRGHSLSVLSLAQGNLSQRRQATASSKAGMGIIWI